MDVFKKLAVVRRGNGRSDSIVSDDGCEDNDFCYHQHDGDTNTEISDSTMDGTDCAPYDSSNGGSSSLYGRRRNSGSLSNNSRTPMMAVVTSTRFDSDDIFSMVARAMIHRYQHQNMSEREAIDGTLGKVDDLRAFIETLDHKFDVLNAEITDGMDHTSDVDDTLSEIIIKTRSLFNDTLKKMSREKESILGISMDSIKKKRHRNEMMVDDRSDYRRQLPKTPKNLRMSPMRTSSFNYKNNGVVSQCESLDGEESNNNIFRKTFKRSGRWFFPPNKKERLTTPNSNSTMKKPFPIKAALPKFHFDFGGKSSMSSENSLIFGDLGQGPKPLKSSQIDGSSSSALYVSMLDRTDNATGSYTSSAYIPPTSPIRKVSIEMKANGINSGAIELVD